MAKGLTEKQRNILNFIVEYIQAEGYPPSIREIGSQFRIGSLRGVTVHLDALARKGYIQRSNTPRSIKLVHPTLQTSDKTAMLPLVGTIAAGVPIAAEEHVEDLIPVPAQLVRNIERAFLLRVKGDSMIGEGILPRDLVVVKPQSTANHGELVAVLLGDEATVKRLHHDKSGYQLMPSNPSYDPIPVRREDARIIGKVIGLIRDYTGMAF
ncbi:MAG: transcriptional repressor LexA [Fimbriimonadaceae bacterium]|uniref:LexA repressor n=1 Tax=Candidatus Nitrosymbiomonas proteolyticus TaxID=2608984 RepID=A0A809R847_9BACT|nr:transcriptional repressor LexA [Fimbriimonadaceae bacterium]NUM38669.1 transcriptional repressor LexA [Armatimonadota bacterium]BBO23639.1 SOS regulatory protein LexA [Candidatus Nitrosymbiomonas proteolyticus]